jgi:hypothetical protein
LVMSEGRIKVLYVAGFGRSGSTLLGNVLGQVEGFVSVGEVRSIWEHGLIENKVCGSGTLFEDCSFWQPVLDEAYGGMGKVDPRKMIQLRESWARTKHIPLMLTPPEKRLIRCPLAEGAEDYAKVLERLPELETEESTRQEKICLGELLGGAFRGPREGDPA